MKVFYQTTEEIVASGGIIDFQASATIRSIVLSGGWLYATVPTSQVNITESFVLNSTSRIVGSNPATSRINLLSTCESQWSGTGATSTTYNLVSSVILTNYGTMNYSPSSSSGMRLDTNGVFINQGTFIVNNTAVSDLSVNSALTTLDFINNGFMSITMVTNRVFEIRTRFTNNGILQVYNGNVFYFFGMVTCY